MHNKRLCFRRRDKRIGRVQMRGQKHCSSAVRLGGPNWFCCACPLPFCLNVSRDSMDFAGPGAQHSDIAANAILERAVHFGFSVELLSRWVRECSGKNALCHSAMRLVVWTASFTLRNVAPYSNVSRTKGFQAELIITGITLAL